MNSDVMLSFRVNYKCIPSVATWENNEAFE